MVLMPESTDVMRLSLLRFKKIIPIPEQSMVQMLCYLLECLLTPENTPPDCAKELYELYFVFAAVWAFGGAMFQDQVVCGPLSVLALSTYLQCVVVYRRKRMVHK